MRIAPANTPHVAVSVVSEVNCSAPSTASAIPVEFGLAPLVLAATQLPPSGECSLEALNQRLAILRTHTSALAGPIADGPAMPMRPTAHAPAVMTPKFVARTVAAVTQSSEQSRQLQAIVRTESRAIALAAATLSESKQALVQTFAAYMREVDARSVSENAAVTRNVILPTLSVSKAERNLLRGMDDMDISALAQIVMMECARAQENDLKDIIDEMHKGAQQKQIMRQRMAQAKQAKANLEQAIGQEYIARTKLDVDNTLRIDPDKVSLADYTAQREVAMNAGELTNPVDDNQLIAELTNQLTVYAPYTLNPGPPPALGDMASASAEALVAAQRHYEDAVQAFASSVKAFGEKNGVGEAQAKSILSVAGALQISDAAGASLYRLYADARGMGVGEDSFEQFVTANIHSGSVQADAQRFIDGPIKAAKAQEAAAVKQHVLSIEETVFRLRMLGRATIEGTDTHAAIDAQIAGLQVQAKNEADRLSPAMQDELNNAVNVQNAQLTNALTAAFEADNAAMRAQFDARVASASAAQMAAAPFTFGLSLVAGPTAQEQACEGLSSPQFDGQVEKVAGKVRIQDGKEVATDVYQLKVKFLADSEVGRFLAGAYGALGWSAEAFNQSVQSGDLRRDLTMTIGSVTQAGGPFMPKTVFAFREDDMALGLERYGVPTDPWQRYSSWTGWWRGNGAEVNAQMLPPGEHAQAGVDTFYPAFSSVTGRSPSDLTAPVDPTAVFVTGDVALDAMLCRGLNGPLAGQDLSAVFETVYSRYPHQAHFSQFVDYVAQQMRLKREPKFSAGVADALQTDLKAAYAAKMTSIKEVADKDNDRLFRSRPEPSAALSRKTMKHLDITIEELQQKMDALGDMTQDMQVRLQLAMDRRAKMYETLSAIIKKCAQTGDAIIGNMK